jgi:RNA polymerase sigma-B factor
LSPSRVERSDDELFREFASGRRRSVRNQLVERHIGLAVHVAKRYDRRGVGSEDLRQVAMLGLVKAVDRYDPDHGASFSSFAGRTIEGELKRYFRDKTWAVRVPRGAKELHLAVRNAGDELSKRLGRSPTVAELAAHLDIDRDDVLRGMAASAAYNVGSIDAGSPDDTNEAPTDRSAVLSTLDAGFEDSENRQLVVDLIGRLPARDQEIIRLRFFEELSQSDIAERVGVSQMHVSRLLRRSFEQMREWMEEGASPSR